MKFYSLILHDIRILMALVLTNACGFVMGQTTDHSFVEQDSIQEVVVTGKKPISHLSSPTTVQSIQGRDLERTNSLSVADAVRYFSGVQVKDYGGIGGFKTLNIRSIGTTHTGVFYNGIQLGNAQNGQIDLGKFSLDNMESVDLYNAQTGNIFQSAKEYGAAGTIYLTPIKPVFSEKEATKLQVKFRTTAYQAIDKPLSYGLTNPSIMWQQKINSRVHSNLSAEWVNSDGEYKFRYKKVKQGQTAYDAFGMRRNDDINAMRIEGGFDGNIDNGNWDVRAYFYSSQRGLPGFVGKNQFENDNQRLWDKNFFLQGSFQKQITTRYRFKLQSKYAYDYTYYEDKNMPKGNNTYKQQEGYLSFANQYQFLPYWSAVLSADFQYNRMDADLDHFAYPKRYTALVALASELSFNWLKLQASVLENMVHETVEQNTAMPNKQILTPAVSLSVKPFRNADMYLRAFYKQNVRMPTFNDLYYVVIGSRWLEPERCTQYDAGVTFGQTFRNSAFIKWSFQTDVYYNKVIDKIVAIPASNLFQWSITNLGEVEIRGLDASINASWRIASVYLNTRLNYTFQKAQDVTNSQKSYYKHQISYIPKHNGSAVASAEYKTWRLNYTFIYIGSRYSNKENIPANYMPSWCTSDISLSKTFVLRSTQIKLAAEANNLFNRYYDVVINYPLPGRNYQFMISLTI